MDTLLETLAALEHEQWKGFSKPLAKEEALLPERMCRWHTLWTIPYEKLPESVKEMDRSWARKVLDALVQRLPATQMNPTRGEVSIERLAWISGVVFCVVALLDVLYFEASPFEHWYLIIGLFVWTLGITWLWSHQESKRTKLNEKILFLRRFLEVDQGVQ